MNLQQIEALIAQDESEHLELKRSTGQRTDATKSAVARSALRSTTIAWRSPAPGRFHLI
jgi:hypothetical protein